MQTDITLKNRPSNSQSIFYLTSKQTDWTTILSDKKEIVYLKKKIADKEDFILINQLNRLIYIQLFDELENKDDASLQEALRMIGHKMLSVANSHKIKEIQLKSLVNNEALLLAIAEGAALSNYQFLKYKSKQDKNSLNQLIIISDNSLKTHVDELNILVDAVFKARDWVNEPQSYLDAETFAREMQAMSKSTKMSVQVFHKKQIEALKMGGLIAVNAGSVKPPTFTIMEWKPKKPTNKQPVVLVGKGVVYDTGGLSLKPTPNSMDSMKCDMAGGALVAATMYAIAKAELPIHVIGLVPATDNRPGENAYAPGDVIHMFDGQTVEMLNADAEGRMILADALSFAKKYNPELVLDFATLTGAAAAAIGGYGIVCMGNADEATKLNLKISGNMVHERLVEFPFWDDYAKLLKSDIADMKNIGGPVAGAITAGKFLEKFIDYPWMHFDIAGPAWNNAADGYRPKNGSGVGVRLMFNFLKNLSA